MDTEQKTDIEQQIVEQQIVEQPRNRKIGRPSKLLTEEQKKTAKAEYDKRYYELNKDKISTRVKAWRIEKKKQPPKIDE